METYIERHTYAPELSKFFYKGVHVKNVDTDLINNRLKSVSEIEKEIFKKPGVFKKGVRIDVIYPPEYARLNKTYSGIFDTYKSIQITLKFINKKHFNSDRELLDGSILPVPKLKYSFYWIM